MAWWGQIAQAGADTLSAILGYVGQHQTNKKNYKIWQEQAALSRELQDRQNAETWKMWNAENEYNTPENQRKLWEEAGFSPYAALNTDPTAGSMSSAGATLPSSPEYTSPLIGLGDAVSRGIQNQINTAVAVKNMEKIAEDTRGKRLENDYLEDTYHDRVETAWHDRRKADSDADTAGYNADIARLAKHKAYATAETEVEQQEEVLRGMKAKNAWQELDNKQKKIITDTFGIERAIDLNLQYSSLANSLLVGDHTRQQILESLARTINEGKKGKLIDEQIEGQDIANQSAQVALDTQKNEYTAKYGDTPEEVAQTLETMWRINCANLGIDEEYATGMWKAAQRLSNSHKAEDAFNDGYYYNKVHPSAEGGFEISIFGQKLKGKNNFEIID